jgi:hypothetical protein
MAKAVPNNTGTKEAVSVWGRVNCHQIRHPLSGFTNGEECELIVMSLPLHIFTLKTFIWICSPALSIRRANLLLMQI